MGSVAKLPAPLIPLACLQMERLSFNPAINIGRYMVHAFSSSPSTQRITIPVGLSAVMDDRLSSQLEHYASQVTASATLIIRHLKSLKDEPSTLPSQTSVPTAVGTAQLRLAEAAFQLLHFTRDPGNVLTQLTVDVRISHGFPGPPTLPLHHLVHMKS